MKRLLNYFKYWQFSQWIRLIVGIVLIGSMAANGFNWMILLFGLIFILQAFTNTGCAFGGSCTVNNYRRPVSNRRFNS